MISLFFSLWLAFVPAHASAQSTPGFAAACTGQINDRLGAEQRLYRRVLFGLEHAKDAAIGSARYDQNAVAWMKVAANRWQSSGVGMMGKTKTDSEMDRDTERDELDQSDASAFRLGLFSTKGVLTSELIPAALQNFRALQCRADAVCEAARRTISGGAGTSPSLLIQTPGCRDIPVPALTQCSSKTIGDVSSALSYCPTVANAMMTHEESLLKFSVAYDAAYRTLLQFTGTFDDLLTIFKGDMLSPIRQAQSLLFQLSRIPCFLSVCHE